MTHRTACATGRLRAAGLAPDDAGPRALIRADAAALGALLGGRA